MTEPESRSNVRKVPDNVSALFQPLSLQGLNLKNRIVLAPCTRNCALPGLVPTDGAIDYYRARAEAGLLITEATLIRADCQGYRDTPGIYSDDQVQAWRRVTDAVHDAGGVIFSQLWHVGRLAHPYYCGTEPVCPSRVPTEGKVHQTQGVELEHVWPRALERDEIAEIVDDFATAGRNAMAAGFDGVEIHGANGYLVDQFLRQTTNLREDAYGGDPERRARFAIEVVDAVAAETGSSRVGLRLSPAAYFGLMDFVPGDTEGYIHLIGQMNDRDLAYLHVGIHEDVEVYDYLGGRPSQFLRRHYNGTLIGNGGYDAPTAAREIAEGAINLVSFGKPFIANPDLVARLRSEQPTGALSPRAAGYAGLTASTGTMVES